MELDEQSAGELNELCEYAVRIQSYFEINPYVLFTKENSAKDDYDYYQHLFSLAKRIMSKHGDKWFTAVEFGMMATVNTKPFTKKRIY